MNTDDVVAGVLQCDDGRYLLAERPAGKRLGGYLEFPGGKQEPGESPRAALVREFEEEIGVRVEQAEPLIRFEHRYPDRHVRVRMYRITGWHGTPRGREGQRLIFALSDELPVLPLLPANGPILAALALPATLLVTPLLDGHEEATFAERFESALSAEVAPGGAIVRTRSAALPSRLAARLVAAAERVRCPLLFNAGRPCETPHGFDGVHLPAAVLSGLDARPAAEGRIGASVHTVEEAAHARAIGLDYVVAGSVRETPSHPGVAPLGWSGFEKIAAAAGRPAYAVGGMTPADLPKVRAHWGQGIAAIRAFWPETA